jgi:hypothetical protein
MFVLSKVGSQFSLQLRLDNRISTPPMHQRARSILHALVRLLLHALGSASLACTRFARLRPFVISVTVQRLNQGIPLRNAFFAKRETPPSVFCGFFALAVVT